MTGETSVVTGETSAVELPQHAFEHYRHAEEELRRHIAWRMRLVGITLALVTLLLFRAYNPEQADAFFEEAIQKVTKVQKHMDLDFLNCIAWFLFSTAVVLYYQRTILLERQAGYLRALERRLAQLSGVEFTSRYLDASRRPRRFLKVVGAVYGGVFTALVLLSGVFVLSQECYMVRAMPRQYDPVLFAVDLLAFAMIIAMTILFLLDVARGDWEVTDAYGNVRGGRAPSETRAEGYFATNAEHASGDEQAKV